jgi:hypothetical protein
MSTTPILPRITILARSVEWDPPNMPHKPATRVGYMFLHTRADPSVPGGVRIELHAASRDLVFNIEDVLKEHMNAMGPTAADMMSSAISWWHHAHLPSDRYLIKGYPEPTDGNGPDKRVSERCTGCPAFPDKIDEVACAPELIDLARKRYESYNANSGWLNYQGNRCPAWPDLTSAVRSHWCRTVVDELR